MGKTILFSPVGGTDPIGENTMRDGSLLHICRHYKPDKVILYLSQEMLQKHDKDNRYLFCLGKLAELQNRDLQYRLVKRPELTEVQKFDYFYQDFHEILSGLLTEMDEDDLILLNTSSGTPQMKSALVVLCTLGEFPAKMIQVVTPTRKLGEHNHSKEYDLETLWELNEDNLDGSENRCEEIKCPTLSDMMKKEIIRKHIRVYDYRAALSVAETLTGTGYERLKLALTAANDRYLLKETIGQYRKVFPEFRIPVSNILYRDCFEYALFLQIKLARGEYADFIRSISPLIADLFTLILEHHCHVNLMDYCGYNKRGVLEWKRRKLYNTDILAILEAGYSHRNGFEYSWVKSDHLQVIIINKSSDNRLKDDVVQLRGIEENIRNVAAHEIVSITDEKIKTRTGLYSEQIMKIIRDLFNYTGMKVKKEDWNSYDEMNEFLMGL